MDLALGLALSSAVSQRVSTCFTSQTLSPAQAALHMLCLHSNVILKNVAAHQVQDADFVRLTAAASKIGSSPLVFAVCDPSDIEQTVQNLLEMGRLQDFKVLVCERSTEVGLDSWQTALGFFARTTGINVHLLAGRFSSAHRFTDFGQRV